VDQRKGKEADYATGGDRPLSSEGGYITHRSRQRRKARRRADKRKRMRDRHEGENTYAICEEGEGKAWLTKQREEGARREGRKADE